MMFMRKKISPNRRGTGELLVKTKFEKMDNRDRIVADLRG